MQFSVLYEWAADCLILFSPNDDDPDHDRRQLNILNNQTKLHHTTIPPDPYKYRAGVLIHRSSDITSIADLRGRRSCHTGVGRTAGWHIPIGQLLAKQTMIPDCKSELQTVSKFFYRSCAPGKWSSDPLVDRQLSESLFSPLLPLVSRGMGETMIFRT